jgi:hypothetical protein
LNKNGNDAQKPNCNHFVPDVFIVTRVLCIAGLNVRMKMRAGESKQARCIRLYTIEVLYYFPCISSNFSRAFALALVTVKARVSHECHRCMSWKLTSLFAFSTFTGADVNAICEDNAFPSTLRMQLCQSCDECSDVAVRLTLSCPRHTIQAK